MTGIRGLKRLDVRDTDGLLCGLLIGRTDEPGQLVVGVVPNRGDVTMIVLDGEALTEVLTAANRVSGGGEL